MAQQLKLVRKNDFVADVDSLDLLAFTSGWTVQREGYIPNFDGGSEVITLSCKSTTRDGLATVMQALETKLQQIQNFIESVAEPYCVVLREQAPNETSARDSLVTGFSVKLGSSLHQANLFVQDYRLAIDRVGPAWEASAASTITVSAASFAGESQQNAILNKTENAGTIPVNGADNLEFTMAETPFIGTVVTLQYIRGSVAHTATGVFNGPPGEGYHSAVLADPGPESGLLVGTVDNKALVVLSTGNGGSGDPGTAASVSYLYGSLVGIGGIKPGRIGRFTVKGISGAGTINEIWAGFRTARFGTLADFVSIWEAESGTTGTDASITTDATATPGGGGNTKIAVSFATATMQKRCTLTAYQISNSHYTDLRGTFDIVARLKVGAATTTHVRLDGGMMNGSTFTAGQIGDLVTVESTSWKYYYLGRITWPPTSRVTSNLDAMKNACLALYAERTAGNTNLEFDHYIPIPVDEGTIHLENLNVVYSSNDTNQRAEIYCGPDGNIVGVQYASGVVVDQVIINAMPETWIMPVDQALVIIAAQTASPALADQMTLLFEVFRRYPTLRGAA